MERRIGVCAARARGGKNRIGLAMNVAGGWPLHIIYPGKYADGCAFVWRVDRTGQNPIEIRLAPAYHHYGHFTSGHRHNDWLVSDGYYHPDGVPENDNWGGETISLVKVGGIKPRLNGFRCARTSPFGIVGIVIRIPLLSIHRDSAVYFTSNRSGARSVSGCRAGTGRVERLVKAWLKRVLKARAAEVSR